MDDLKSLTLLLSRQVEIYTELLRLENSKTRILLEGKPQELDAIINEEQSLIIKSSNLEQERQNLQQKMGIGNLTLKQIISNYAESNEFDLNRRYIELNQLLEKNKKANSLNTKLIDSRLKTMQHMLQGNDNNRSLLTYSKQGFILKG